jgi:hypothetical protein
VRSTRSPQSVPPHSQAKEPSSTPSTQRIEGAIIVRQQELGRRLVPHVPSFDFAPGTDWPVVREVEERVMTEFSAVARRGRPAPSRASARAARATTAWLQDHRSQRHLLADTLCAGFLTGCFRVLEALITRRPRTRMLRRFERPGLAGGAAGPFSA